MNSGNQTITSIITPTVITHILYSLRSLLETLPSIIVASTTIYDLHMRTDLVEAEEEPRQAFMYNVSLLFPKRAFPRYNFSANNVAAIIFRNLFPPSGKFICHTRLGSTSRTR